ncbi:cytochrome b5-like [Hyposmocoma kahamanoa]|uniref:cytochrome b5-like n=1 Tax=Hyposmocoma kahamanoa TaxID=1477025 RepID=UPI000E6D7213|nr:cytochrome b5-like [Hyposmocoma kahamanoa]
MNKEISVEKVASHKFDKKNKSSVCWIIIHNTVYDVTKFLKEHPGGADCLIKYSGQNATQAFENKGHSAEARELLKKYQIGLLPPVQRDIFFDPRTQSSSQWTDWVCCHGPTRTAEPERSRPAPASSFNYWWLLALIVVLGGAFVAKQKMS